MLAEMRRTKGGKTKQRIARSALELFVTQGVMETTTKDIAAHANISEGGIYRHFASKDELAWELFLDHYQRLGQKVKDVADQHVTLREKSDAIVTTYCQIADDDWLLFSYHLLTLHQQLPRLTNIHPNPVDVIEDVIRTGMRDGEIPTRPVSIVAAMALGVVLEVATHKIYGRLNMPLMDCVDMMRESVWHVVKG